jgi:hypothetical protein
MWNQSEVSSLANPVEAKQIGWVYSVILDENDEYASKSLFKSALIGAIRFRTTDNQTPNDKNIPVAFPFDKNCKTLPVIGEQVEIYGQPGNYSYKRIGAEPNPSYSAKRKINEQFQPKSDKQASAAKLNETAQTGIVETNNNTKNDELDNLGKYYDVQPGLHKLKLYEGDTLIESRHGQSIRFSGYNNKRTSFSPTIIIRNSESITNKKKNYLESVEEDITGDGSIISLSSGDYELANISSNLKETPKSFKEFPEKLIGDQILINSGRLIFSAKSAEMMFYSKKNYGFVSDGGLSINNAKGIEASVGEDINIVMNDRDFSIHSGKGSIFLGDEDREPLVKGKTLVSLLRDLIAEIIKQQYLTPSGPTKIGPENVAAFKSIDSKLESMLSKYNQTS